MGRTSYPKISGGGYSHHRYSSPKPKGDKAEFSPNSRAKCNKCKQIIQKGSRRVGKEEFFSPRNAYIHRYFHESCLSDCQKANLKFSGNVATTTASPSNSARKNLQAEFDRQVSQTKANQNILKERQGLRQQLRLLRTLLSTRFRCQPYLIFHDSTLDDLVLKLPATLHQLRDVNGIGPKKLRNLGTPIIRIINQYAKLHMKNKSNGRVGNSASSAAAAAAADSMAVASLTNTTSSSLTTKQQNELRGRLRRLRTSLAAQHPGDYPLYLIFTNKTLDDIILKVPTTQAQLLSVNGIGERKVEQFGNDIIAICREYNNYNPTSGMSSNVKDEFQHSMSSSRSSNSIGNRRTLSTTSATRHFDAGATTGIAGGSNDEDDDIVQVTQALSAEQIVNMAFEHAENNGYVLSIDDDVDINDDGFI